MGNAAARASMKRLQRALRELAYVPSRASAGAAKQIGKLVDLQFTTGTDSYGMAWASLEQATFDKGRHPPPLTDTGEMRASIVVEPARRAGVRVTVGTHYAQFHQVGTRFMAARPILPTRGLPPAWADAIGTSTRKAYSDTMRGAR